MVELIEYPSVATISKIARPEYPLLQKIKNGGTGSIKMMHLSGLGFLDNFDRHKDVKYSLAFELRPKGLIGRSYGDDSRTFFIEKETLEKVIFTRYDLRIVTKNGIIIRHEAIVEIKLFQQTIQLYVPRTTFKSAKKFFIKDWLKGKTEYHISDFKPELAYNTLIFEIIGRLLDG